MTRIRGLGYTEHLHVRTTHLHVCLRALQAARFTFCEAGPDWRAAWGEITNGCGSGFPLALVRPILHAYGASRADEGGSSMTEPTGGPPPVPDAVAAPPPAAAAAPA